MTILSIRIDIVCRSHRSHSSASACLLSSDHLQMPAMASLISNRVGMTALYSLLRILLCFEFVPPTILPRPLPFFAGSQLPSSNIFFLVGQFLSDIWSGRLAFFCRTFFQNDCPTSPTNFDNTIYPVSHVCRHIYAGDDTLLPWRQPKASGIFMTGVCLFIWHYN